MFSSLASYLHQCSCAIEYAMFISHGVWLLRTRELRRRAKTFGMSFDDFPEAKEWQAGGWKLDVGHHYRNLVKTISFAKMTTGRPRDCASQNTVQMCRDTDNIA